MKEILKRIFTDTPKFFKRLRFFGLSLSAVSTTLLNIDGIPEKLIQIASEGVWIGLTIAAVSQLTAKNPEELK